MKQRISKNENDIVFAVAKLAATLTDESMDDLRLRLTSDPEGRIGPSKQEFLGYSKGQLVEMVLLEEFLQEFPRDICEV